MKKSIALTLVAALSIPSTAMALQPATRGVLVGGSPAGNATSTFAGQAFGGIGGCFHNLVWTSPAGPGGGSTLCVLRENNVLGQMCSPGANVNIPVVAGDGFTFCQGYLPPGPFPVPVVMFLQEFPGNPALGGFGFFDGIPVALAVQMF